MTDRTEDAQLIIGQFGRLAQLSRKALRLYDDKGLLLPSRINPNSGYRYYTCMQVALARHIRLLRLMEMLLEAIATVPAFPQSIMPTLRQLWDHIREHGSEPSGDPVCLYFGLVNESDDGPIEIGEPFTGLVPPAGDIKVRELPAHKTVQVRTFANTMNTQNCWRCGTASANTCTRKTWSPIGNRT